MRFLIKFPSRERPEKFKACIENIREMCAGYDYYIHATLDENDPRIEEYKPLLENIPHNIGVSTGKIHACNRDMEDILYPWDVVILMSDDMKIVSKRFLTVVEKHFEVNGLDTILHLNDGNWYGNKLMTMNIQGRLNYERFNYLYCPEYISLWSDNEQQNVADYRDWETDRKSTRLNSSHRL